MATTIPIEHPSLALGSIVDRNVLKLVSSIVGSQSQIDAAQQKLSSYVLMKRSLAMMVNELLDMGIDTSDVRPRLDEVDQAIKRAGSEYLTTRLQAEEAMQKSREALAAHSSTELIESPIDYGTSQLRRLPLSSDGMKLDAQYFSCIDESEEDMAASIERYVRESVGGLGSRAGDLAKEAGAQVTRQLKNNSLSGTLVITANCDHRNVALFDPLIIDPDKAIAAWNRLYPSNAVPEHDRAQLQQLATAAKAEGEDDSMSLICGVTYGSSFVGMVHFLKTSSVRTGVDEELAAQVRERLQIGGWLEHASGGFGVDRETLNDVRKILSMQSVNSHVSIIASGVLTSIASNEVKLGISKIAQPEPVKSLELLTLVDENGGETHSIDADAALSKKANQAIQLQNARSNSLIRTLSEVDRGANRVLDVNSLLGAFENYLAAVQKEGAGAPTGFYLRTIGKREIAKQWLKRNVSELLDPAPKSTGGRKKP